MVEYARPCRAPPAAVPCAIPRCSPTALALHRDPFACLRRADPPSDRGDETLRIATAIAMVAATSPSFRVLFVPLRIFVAVNFTQLSLNCR